MAFERLSYPRFQKRSSMIAAQISRKIQNGEYKKGARLPPERVMAEQMAVSRPSVREAISALQIVGIVESRPGNGTYVCEAIDALDFAHQAFKVLEESDSPLVVLQARKAMEIGVARLAIMVAGDADVRRITDSWKEKYEKGIRGEYEEFLKYGKKFHLSLAQATHNDLIVKMMDNLLDATLQPLWIHMRKIYYSQDVNRLNEMLDVHNRIAEAIQARNSEKAITALEEHFDILIHQMYRIGNDSAGNNV